MLMTINYRTSLSAWFAAAQKIAIQSKVCGKDALFAIHDTKLVSRYGVVAQNCLFVIKNRGLTMSDMVNDEAPKYGVSKIYNGPEDVYDELVGDENNSWLLGLVAFAVVEEQKIEWIKHHSNHNGGPPTSDEIKHWYAQLPPGAALRAKGTAENALEVYSTAVVEEVGEDTRKEIEEGVIVSEIRDLKRFWPQFGVNLAGGFISSLLFALLLAALAVIVLKNPSPIDMAKQMQINPEGKSNGN